MAAAPEGSFAQAFGDVSGASKKQLAALEAEYRGADVRWAEKVASAGDSRGASASAASAWGAGASGAGASAALAWGAQAG